MIKKILFKNYVYQHLSLLILAVGSLFYFMLNIMLRESLNYAEYGLYSIFITYLTMLFSFGLLGFEQTFLRLTNLRQDKVIINMNIIKIIFMISILVPLLSSLLIKYIYFENINILSIYISSIGVVLLLFFYNYFRVQSAFVFSQLINNGWRIIIFIVIGIFLILYKTVNIRETINIFSLVIFISLSIPIMFIKKGKIQIVNIKERYWKLTFGFFISLLLMSMISYGDRFLIERKYGLKIVGDYFFYSNVFLYPLSLLQTYIGFRELVEFKKIISLKILMKKLKYTLLIAIIASALVILLGAIIDLSSIYKLHMLDYMTMILLLSLLGIVKVVYSILSAAMGAIGTSKVINIVNYKSIISITIIIIPFIYYKLSIEYTIILFILFWIARCLIWYNSIKENL